MKADFLFVYGTMMEQERNHSRLYEAGAMFVGEFETLDTFRLYVMNRNDAPIAIRDPAGHRLEGELYVLPEGNISNYIDVMEGHPTIYRREPVSLVGFSPRLDVEMYVYQHEPGPNDRRITPGILRVRYRP